MEYNAIILMKKTEKRASEIEGLNRKLIETHAEFQDVTNHLNDLIQVNESLGRELQQLKASKSWRLTAPLRFLFRCYDVICAHAAVPFKAIKSRYLKASRLKERPKAECWKDNNEVEMQTDISKFALDIVKDFSAHYSMRDRTMADSKEFE